MKRLILALSVLLASASAAAAQQTPAGVGLSGPPVVTFVEAGRLLADPSNGVVQRSKTLVISGNQVVDIRDGFVGDPAQGRVIDLRDSFVLPGLIDSHVHLTGQQNPNSRLEEVTQSEAAQAMVGARYARRTLMAGFTTVADLGADNEAIFALREAVKLVPYSQLLVETDSPFLAPSPHRGMQNTPAQIPTIVRAMAVERGDDLAELCDALSKNTERVFGSFA